MDALMHFRSGSAILKSLSFPCCATPRLSGTSQFLIVPSRIGDFDDLASAFTRLSAEEYTFAGPASTTVDTIPDPPSRFDSIVQARKSINSIITFMYAFLRRSSLEHLDHFPYCFPATVTLELDHIRAMLQAWLQAFNTFLCGQTNSDAEIDLGAKVLLVQHLVACIKISTYFSSDQMIYDSYLNEFWQIMDMTAMIVEADNTLWRKSRGPCFTLDIAMAQPLYFVAHRCRDLALRSRAIDVMKKVGRDGIYTGKTIAKIAEWDCAERGGPRMSRWSRL